jgi:cyclopropane fatty-acyl-phospholipid synthase-like methyltransferase
MSEEQSGVGGAIPQGDSNTMMPDVWGYLLVKYNPRMLIDVGCGFGHTMKWFADYGVHVVGVDGWQRAIDENAMPDHAKLHDFTKGPYIHGTAFDLAWCAEFLEHVEEKYVPNFMPIFQAARVSVITHGEPMQHGHHHVNCQTSNYWIKTFASYGLIYDASETQLLRRTDRHGAAWGRRTLMVFRQQ